MRGIKGTAMSLEERRERKREYQRRWKAAHPGYDKEYAARRYVKHGDRYRAYARKGHLKAKYGLSLEEYEQKLIEQDGVCAICKQPPAKIRLAVDHNHSTGQIRDLLCSKCNNRLGFIEDIDFKLKAEAYLAKHKDKE